MSKDQKVMIPVDRCHTLKAFIQDHVGLYVNISETEKLVNDQMAAYEEREIQRTKDLEAKRGVVDEDGFVTMVSTKSRTSTLDAEVLASTSQSDLGQSFDPFAPLKAALTARKTGSSSKSAPTGLKSADNFYRFQIRRKRAHAMEELRQKFEQDKLRISALKKNKIFD